MTPFYSVFYCIFVRAKVLWKVCICIHLPMNIHWANNPMDSAHLLVTFMFIFQLF